MSQPSDSRPCPFCGEAIKVQAIKCRHCGEFLEDAAGAPALPRQRAQARDPGVVKWVVPVGRSFLALMASYCGLLALVPFPFLLYALMPGEVRRETLKTLLYFCAGMNGLIGFLAVALGVAAIVTILRGRKKGLGRSIFAVGAGLLGGLGYPIWIAQFIEKYIG